MAKLEIACFKVESAIVAASFGADRVELCANAEVGGTTPALSTLQNVKNNISTPVYVMIRPRGGNFVYSETEFADMKHDVETFSNLADGFVFGIITQDGIVDTKRNKELINLASGKPCTFHRAFDEVKDLERSLEDVAHCGFANILTAGGAHDSIADYDMLSKLVRAGLDLGINVIPGGGVRSTNIAALRSRTNAQWFHSSAIMDRSTLIADAKEIQRIRHVLR